MIPPKHVIRHCVLQAGITSSCMCWWRDAGHILLLCNLYTRSFCAWPCVPRFTCVGNTYPLLPMPVLCAAWWKSDKMNPCTTGKDGSHWDHRSDLRHSYHSTAGNLLCILAMYFAALFFCSIGTSAIARIRSFLCCGRPRSMGTSLQISSMHL